MNNANFKKENIEKIKSNLKGSSPKPKKSDFKRKNVESKKSKKKTKTDLDKPKKQNKNKSKRKIKAKNLMRGSLDFSNTSIKLKGGKSPKKVKLSQSNKFISGAGNRPDNLEKKLGKNNIPLSSKRKKSKIRKERK